MAARDSVGNVVSLDGAASSPIVVSTAGLENFGTDLAMVWVLDGGDDNTKTLRAFKITEGFEIYNSSWQPEDATLLVPHAPPINVSDHSVFIGTNTGIACFRFPHISFSKELSLIALHVDNPSGANHAYFRTGWGADTHGSVKFWDGPAQVRAGSGTRTRLPLLRLPISTATASRSIRQAVITVITGLAGGLTPVLRSLGAGATRSWFRDGLGTRIKVEELRLPILTGTANQIWSCFT
jgi:hypothetical protein